MRVIRGYVHKEVTKCACKDKSFICRNCFALLQAEDHELEDIRKEPGAYFFRCENCNEVGVVWGYSFLCHSRTLEEISRWMPWAGIVGFAFMAWIAIVIILTPAFSYLLQWIPF